MTQFSSVQFSSVAQSCPTLCNPMGCGTAGFPVHHQFPELSQTHVCRVGDAIQLILSLSYPFSFSVQSFPAKGSFPVSHYFASGPQRIKFQLQHQSSQSIFRMISFRIDWFDLLAFQGTLKVFSKTTVQNHQFFGTQPSLWSNSHT